MLAVVVSTFARRFVRDQRRCGCGIVKIAIAIVNVVVHDGSYHFVIAVWRAKEAESARVKRYWEIIADRLSKAG
jgi:hypothetical protein